MGLVTEVKTLGTVANPKGKTSFDKETHGKVQMSCLITEVKQS